MTGRQRSATRDYKHGGARAGGFDLGRYRQFGAGLALGLSVALGMWLHDQRNRPIDAAAMPEALAAQAGPEADATGVGDDAGEQYDFYDMLPRFEVVVPEQERDVRRDLPSLTVERPGIYVLQVGSYRSQPDAERLREMLAKQGIDAQIQRVAVDDNVWHRVRIGPNRDLNVLNATRRELQATDFQPILIRVGD